MYVYPAKSSRFESTDFASVMIDDVGCSRRHQCPRCDDYAQFISTLIALALTKLMVTTARAWKRIFPSVLQQMPNVK